MTDVGAHPRVRSFEVSCALCPDVSLGLRTDTRVRPYVQDYSDRWQEQNLGCRATVRTCVKI
jgi:hypothetical protein